jgi:hypothetical protein
MSSLQTNTVVDHTGDAGFRAWASEYSNALQTIGLVQTADTGQINLVTATRPSTSVNAGYQVWRFNDAQQATKPIFVKIFYGTTNLPSAPRIQIQVGTGSDGAGNLMNPSSTFNVANGNAPTSTVTNYLSNFSLVAGCLAIAWKIGAWGTLGSFFSICRTCDTNGDPNDLGFSVYGYGSSSTSGQNEQVQFRRSDNTWSGFAGSGSNSATALIPGPATAASFVGADAQVVLHFGAFPRIQPIHGLLAVKTSEFGADSTFTAAPVGATTRTYVVLGSTYFGNGAGSFTQGFGNTVAATGWTLAMIWET